MTTVEPETDLAADERPLEETDDAVRCRSCDAELTRRALAVQRGGSTTHTFRNPAGYSWTITCFRRAPGCSASGEPTTDATWFPGYAWSFALCGGCGRHLGWWFHGADGSFVGLIATRIR